MDIIKKLQLNKNPKNIDSGSIVGAKNVMLDSTKTVITNEYGFISSYETPEGFDIKGCINCNEELCVFLYNEENQTSKIDRIDDNGNIINSEDFTFWNWEGGKVIGTFAYNYKRELILAVSELTNDNSKHIPLKIINFNKKQCLNLEASIPYFTPSYQIKQEGVLICGVYTFFIRFKLHENTYTKWFQLTDDIIIIDALEKEKPIHHFEGTQLSTQVGTNEEIYNIVSANTEDFKELYINSNEKSDKNIKLNINFVSTDEASYTECQIGYIIKRNSEILGRLLGDYTIDYEEDLVINFDDNKFIEDVVVDDFLEEPHQFYNVKNLINYNNRLYISNYSEYENHSEESLSSLIDSVVPKFKHKVILDNPEKYHYLTTVDGGQEVVDITLNVEGLPNNGNEILNRFEVSGFYDYICNELEQVCTKLQNSNPLIGDEIHYTIKKATLYIAQNQNQVIPIFYFDISNYTFDSDNPQVIDERTISIIKEHNICYLIKGNSRIALNNAKWYLYCETNDDPNNSNLPYYRISQGILNDNDGIRYNSNDTYYDFKFKNTKIIEDVRGIGTKYNNNRTLIPGQVYNFYIHFVRKDLSNTEGYKIKNTDNSSFIDNDVFDIYTEIKDSWTHFPSINVNNENYYIAPFIKNLADENKAVLTFPKFEVNQTELINKGFIGFFISYEKVETTILNVVPISLSEREGSEYIDYTNTELIYNLTSFNGKKLEVLTSRDNNLGYRKNNNIINKINNLSIYNTKTISILLSESYDSTHHNDINDKNKVYYRHGLYNIENIYKSKIKTLYQLTPITFINLAEININSYILSTNEDTAYMYLPGFFNNEKIITYNKSLIISSVQTNVYNNLGEKQNDYAIKTYTYGTYSQTPINAFSIKEDYEKGSVVIHSSVYSNTVLAPSKLHDFLEIKPAYTALPLKSYTNYQDSTIDIFDKTIYRSDVISDESLNNGFRHFSIENYKNIIENKGNIVNIVGIGLYFLVHTEYSLFIFDRNNRLTNETQLQIPDVFDIDYKEVIPSGEGFGGLKYKEESILTKYGYIWFDRISKNIFMFDGKDLKNLSLDIHSLLEHIVNDYDIKISFAEDYISDRLLICITIIPIVSEEQSEENNKNISLTLSYDFITKVFISTHDYSFSNNYKTYNKSYFFSEKYPNKLFSFSNVEYNYLELGSTTEPFIFKKIEQNSENCSYVDIIFTDKYEVPKVLNSISYVLNKINRFSEDKIDDNFDNIFDKYFNVNYDTDKHLNALNLYSGFKLYIVTDLCFSGLLDISQPTASNNDNLVNNINTINSKKPKWNSGIWNFNYFRENITKNVTDNELALIETITYYNPKNRELDVRKINLNKLKAIYNNNADGYNKSDMRSLIVGKYFILRFIFERNDNLDLKFETLDVNISSL